MWAEVGGGRERGRGLGPLGLGAWGAGAEPCWGLLARTALLGLLFLCVHLLLKPLFLWGVSP